MNSGNSRTDNVYFAHRRLADADIYFVNNHSERNFNDKICLRTSYTQAEYWNPVDGKRYRLPILSTEEEALTLMLHLVSNESGFIVASNRLAKEELPVWSSSVNEQVKPIEGEWNVSFDPKWGGPGTVVFKEPTDWIQHTDPHIKYYSGTAAYEKNIELEKPATDEQILIRFNGLSFMARVWLNEKEVSTVWCSPWEANLTPYIQHGENKLKIEVVNSLMNRMIGDASLPTSQR